MTEITNTNNLQAAWDEIKQWYTNCITAAPKPNAHQPNINIGHIYRWCVAWDISTDDVKAICDKHGVDLEQYIKPK